MQVKGPTQSKRPACSDERDARPTRSLGGDRYLQRLAGGLLYYPWVILGGLFVTIVAISFLGFLWHLPARTRWLFLLAGATFVAGAIGVEMISGLQADRFGEENFKYAMIVTAEEFLEMSAIVILIYAVLDYLTARIGAISVRFRPAIGRQKRYMPRPTTLANCDGMGTENLQPL